MLLYCCNVIDSQHHVSANWCVFISTSVLSEVIDERVVSY